MMKPTPYLYILTLIILTNLWSCKKKEPIFLPSVSILSSRIDNVNSLVMEAQINESNSIFSISSYGFLLVNEGDIPVSIDSPSVLRNEAVEVLNDDQKFKTQFDHLMMDKSYDIFAYLVIECDCEDSNRLILSAPLKDFVDKLQIDSQYDIEDNKLNITSVVIGLTLYTAAGDITMVENNGLFYRQENTPLSTEEIFQQIKNGENTIQSETLASGNFPIFEITIELEAGNHYIQSYAIFNDELILGKRKEILNHQIVGWKLLPIPIINPGHLSESVSFVINDKAYVGTGITQKSSSTQIVTNAFWEYDALHHTWTQKADVPGGVRTNAFGFAANDKGYIGGGESQINASAADKKDVWEYNPMYDEWIKKFDFGASDELLDGSARSKAMVFVINNRPFVGYGMTESGFSSRLYEFLPDDDRNGCNSEGDCLGAWIDKGQIIESLPGYGSRRSVVSFALNEKGYMGYGFKPNGYSRDFFEYDPAGIIDGQSKGTWRKINSNGISRQKAMSFVIGDYAYIGGGGNENIPTYKDWWRFDASANNGDGEWTQLENIGLNNIYSATGFSINDKGYIYGGVITSSVLQVTNTLSVYTPSD